MRLDIHHVKISWKHIDGNLPKSGIFWKNLSSYDGPNNPPPPSRLDFHAFSHIFLRGRLTKCDVSHERKTWKLPVQFQWLKWVHHAMCIPWENPRSTSSHSSWSWKEKKLEMFNIDSKWLGMLCAKELFFLLIKWFYEIPSTHIKS